MTHREFLRVAAITFFAMSAMLSAAAAESGPIVAVTGGQVQGATLEKGGAVFKGIPFAQPPVGDLRWREPAPLKPWKGVRDATAFGSPCTQSPQLNRAGTIAKEDCL
jgi:para-nitrobenzyl esterase